MIFYYKRVEILRDFFYLLMKLFILVEIRCLLVKLKGMGFFFKMPFIKFNKDQLVVFFKNFPKMGP